MEAVPVHDGVDYYEGFAPSDVLVQAAVFLEIKTFVYVF